jgi:hypothetical protein
MTMADHALVYVHGAGKQPKASTLKAQLDRTLFAGTSSATRMGYYAHVRWSGAGSSPGAIGGSAGRERRVRAIARASRPTVPPDEAAEAIVRATLATPGGTHRVGAAPAGRISARDRRQARDLAEALIRNADRVARREAARRGPGIGLPEILVRQLVGVFASDVIDYLYAGYAERMRAPVREALLAAPAPTLVVAHSLGTIVTYDVLSEPAFRTRPKARLVTLGSPLGIDNVQDRLRDRAGRPHPVPKLLDAWANFNDRFDPVALDASLDDAFTPRDFVTDRAVDNKGSLNHDLVGYLEVTSVRTHIRDAMGVG